MKYVVGVFSKKQDARKAIVELKAAGYSSNTSLIAREDAGDIEGEERKEGASKGVATGAALGGIAGIIAGLSNVVLPGIGPLLVGGPLLVAWGVTGVALGALAGGLVGALTGIGVSEEVAKKYEERVKAGDVLVVVDEKGEFEVEVERTFKENGAEEVIITEK